MQLVYKNATVQKQCTDLKIAKKLFGGNAIMATSLFARINALQQASVIKDIVVMPTFHFHKLNGNIDEIAGMVRIVEIKKHIKKLNKLINMIRCVQRYLLRYIMNASKITNYKPKNFC